MTLPSTFCFNASIMRAQRGNGSFLSQQRGIAQMKVIIFVVLLHFISEFRFISVQTNFSALK